MLYSGKCKGGQSATRVGPLCVESLLAAIGFAQEAGEKLQVFGPHSVALIGGHPSKAIVGSSAAE
jgi:hypothetical protein